jgi:hypothetical protein
MQLNPGLFLFLFSYSAHHQRPLAQYRISQLWHALWLARGRAGFYFTTNFLECFSGFALLSMTSFAFATSPLPITPSSDGAHNLEDASERHVVELFRVVVPELAVGVRHGCGSSLIKKISPLRPVTRRP